MKYLISMILFPVFALASDLDNPASNFEDVSRLAKDLPQIVVLRENTKTNEVEVLLGDEKTPTDSEIINLNDSFVVMNEGHELDISGSMASFYFYFGWNYGYSYRWPSFWYGGFSYNYRPFRPTWSWGYYNYSWYRWVW